MKTKLFRLAMIAVAVFLSATSLQAQVTIGDDSEPNATLDVVGQATDTDVADGVIAPRLTGDQIKAKDAVYDTDQDGAIVYATAAVGTSSPKTVNITAAGYYYYDAADEEWKRLGCEKREFIVSQEVTETYVITNEDYISLNVNTPGHTITLPTTDVEPGRIIYFSNVGFNGIQIVPYLRNRSIVHVDAGLTCAVIYLGGTGDGSWDYFSGY